MSLILDRPVTAARTVSPARTSSTAAPLNRTAAAAAAATEASPAEPAAPRPRALPEGTEARGFALYVGIDEVTAAQTGTELGDIVAQIKALVAQIAPAAETHAAVAIAPTGAGGRDVDVVRLALQDPSAVAARRQAAEVAEEPGARGGVVVDISRKRVLLDGEAANLTYKEFELLQYLVLREGRTIERSELIGGLWADGDDEVPNERTIDVHVRRLRAKLGAFEDVVRTVRGAGYRFDRHADVSIRRASTPSPDLF
ncbi:transcriptional regulator [Frigoribacterium sp. PhB107]|uniref:winged helix-turn-helix domain-containing protein n=1 Tax=Frigoribacterium sp. PhB107 TaxID=2485172 RepID=UPI000F49FD1E|nr:winged helix-turn-helix domain-containing protein [Frigoribacterium sp. PhB107]ROP78474.1 transcriptional regulator [Frigoribacterium sp. PhB107]